MAWYSYTLAIAIPMASADRDLEPRTILQKQNGAKRFVYTSSRGGVLLATLRNICTYSAVGADLYLLREPSVLSGAEIDSAAESIAALLSIMQNDPGVVLEGTKCRYEPTTELYCDGFEPLPVEIVYPSTATIKDGYVYLYTQEEVRSLLIRASSSEAPRPVTDDDGESLEYVFGLLKSHFSLLRFAAESGLAVVYGELN